MGNWRTVNIAGTIDKAELGALYTRLAYSYSHDDQAYNNFGPLSFSREKPSLCGLNNWLAPRVSAIGNLAERNYSPEDVRDELQELLKIAPSMMLTVHCGGDWESDECVATIRTGEGLAVILPPEVAKIEAIPDSQPITNLFANLIK